jgi:hypothetical protein
VGEREKKKEQREREKREKRERREKEREERRVRRSSYWCKVWKNSSATTVALETISGGIPAATATLIP